MPDTPIDDNRDGSNEYVKRSKVTGAFLHDQLIATYMLLTSPGYRSMLFVPDAVKDKNGFFSRQN